MRSLPFPNRCRGQARGCQHRTSNIEHRGTNNEQRPTKNEQRKTTNEQRPSRDEHRHSHQSPITISYFLLPIPQKPNNSSPQFSLHLSESLFDVLLSLSNRALQILLQFSLQFLCSLQYILKVWS